MGLVQASQRKNGSHELRNGDKTWPFWYTFSAAATILRCNNHTARIRGPNATATADIAQPLRRETAGFGYPCDGRDVQPEPKREQHMTHLFADPSLSPYRLDASGYAGFPSTGADPKRLARVIVFSEKEGCGVCKRREPSLRRGWDRAAPQSRRRSFQGHGAYRAHRFGCRSAPATLITARNGGRRRSNRPVEPRMRSCWLCCVTPGALHAAAEGFSECCLALQQLSVRGGCAGSSCADQAAVTCAQPSAV